MNSDWVSVRELGGEIRPIVMDAGVREAQAVPLVDLLHVAAVFLEAHEEDEAARAAGQMIRKGVDLLHTEVEDGR